MIIVANGQKGRKVYMLNERMMMVMVKRWQKKYKKIKKRNETKSPDMSIWQREDNKNKKRRRKRAEDATKTKPTNTNVSAKQQNGNSSNREIEISFKKMEMKIKVMMMIMMRQWTIIVIIISELGWADSLLLARSNI